MLEKSGKNILEWWKLLKGAFLLNDLRKQSLRKVRVTVFCGMQNTPCPAMLFVYCLCLLIWYNFFFLRSQHHLQWKNHDLSHNNFCSASTTEAKNSNRSRRTGFWRRLLNYFLLCYNVAAYSGSFSSETFSRVVALNWIDVLMAGRNWTARFLLRRLNNHQSCC